MREIFIGSCAPARRVPFLFLGCEPCTMPDEKIEESPLMREITITLDTYDDIFSDFK